MGGGGRFGLKELQRTLSNICYAAVSNVLLSNEPPLMSHLDTLPSAGVTGLSHHTQPYKYI